jgi:phospholipid/cholesterol/gamma-HCH transport system substrate-binding protein
MENRQNYVLVGTVTLILIGLLVAFVLWLSRYTGEERREFDIFFRQSVSGLTVGSAVSFSGVPIGQVRQIALVPERPEFVRVRIEVMPDAPVLEGTTASLQGVGFTGVTQIQLEGSMAGQAPLTTPGPNGVPVIPSTTSGFSQLLESAPQTLERVNILLERLNDVFDDENRESLAGFLKNIDTVTGVVADNGPALAAAIRETEQTMKAATLAARQLEQLGGTANQLLAEDGQPLLADLRKTVATADTTLNRLDRLLAAAEPGVRMASSNTLPEVNRLVRDLQDVAQALGAVSARLDEDALGALTGGRPLPDYQPEKGR